MRKRCEKYYRLQPFIQQRKTRTFFKNKEVGVLVATDIAARGIY
jgi:hypothetical protein